MPRHLDRSRDFAESRSTDGGVWFEQDGFRFNQGGDLLPEVAPEDVAEDVAEDVGENVPEAEVGEEPDVTEPVLEPKPDDVRPMTPAEKRRATWAAKKAKAAAEPHSQVHFPDGIAPKYLTEQTDDQLKLLVEIAGGKWTTRAAAIASLTEK